MNTVEQQIAQKIAKELTVRAEQVVAAVQLLNEGSTVPFIARYRKEVTGALDDTQLRTLKIVWCICVSWKIVAKSC